MKTIPLLVILFTTHTLARSEVISSKKTLDSVAKAAADIGRLVSSSARPGMGCQEEQISLNRPVLNPDPAVPVIVCRPDSTSLTVAGTEDYSQMIRDYNIEFHPNAAAITNTRHWRLFVHELKKFPPTLMREMAARGGKIRVMLGNGVSEDPQWEQERLRALRMNNDYKRWYDSLSPERQAQVETKPKTDAEVNQGYLSTTEGSRQWDTVSGAGGIFSNRDAISPTRIVLNRMYISATRNRDGTIGDALQGSTNLFLHEHGHALDNLYGPHSISGTEPWRAVLRDPQVQAYAQKIFSTYENNFAEEGFAEAFAYYHSCEASRRQMETHAPKLAEFLKNLTTTAPYRR